MKILQVIDSLPATSGGSRFVVNLSKCLKNSGHEVNVLIIHNTNSHFLEELILNNIEVIDLGAKSLKSRFNPKYILKIAKYLSEYDIIHTHIFPTSYFVAIASIFNKKSAPIVFTEHNAFNKRATNFLAVIGERFIYKKFTKIIGITGEVKIFIKKYITKDESKLQVITNGVDLEKIESVVAMDRSVFGLNSNDFICLMAARFAYQKDHETLIKAFTHLPSNFKLLLAGDGVNLEQSKNLVKKLNLENKIIFLGSRNDIYSIIKMSDVNILSSRYEGFGLSIVEAMAMGKPVIGSNVEGMNNVIKDAGLLFEVGDVMELKKHILKLGLEREFYLEISNKCKSKSTYYTLDVMKKRYLEVYESVMAIV